MPLILVFDLDDTLYPEKSYVESGMRAVAKMLNKSFSLQFGETLERLLEILEKEGRGRVFDIFLKEKKMYSKRVVSRCVATYRHHVPNINLYPDAIEVMSEFKGKKYLVTDGHKIVQQKKIEALKIEKFFEKTYLTNRYGLVNAKPSLHCFSKILQREKCSWSSIIYVGDNPAKDFVNLNLMGSKTVRVLTGRHRSDNSCLKYDAKQKIQKLSDLKKIFKDSYE